MLKYLNITNFAVIERIEIEFQAGLNILTGETGSGKSIIVDTLGLIVGERASAAQIRSQARFALVEGWFDLEDGACAQAIRDLLADVGIDLDAKAEVCIRREINWQGRSRNFINDKSVTALTLRRLGPLLVEIHGQGDQQALTTSQSQRALLDSFGGCAQNLRRVSEVFSKWKQCTADLESVKRELVERERLEDLLRYELTEIERVSPLPREDEDLNAEKTLLAHAEKLFDLKTDIFTRLYESDDS